MINPLDFTGKVTLVTWAAASMGLATAQAFADAGAAIVLADVNEDAVTARAEELVAAGHKAFAIRCKSVTTPTWRQWWSAPSPSSDDSTPRSTTRG